MHTNLSGRESATTAEPAALDIPALCRRYSIGRTLVFSEIRARRLRATRIGRHTLFDIADVDAWWQATRAGDRTVGSVR